MENETLTVTKLRDGVNDRVYGFRLEVVDLGEDGDGDTLTTCVVVPTEGGPAPRRRALSGVARVALQALREALKEHGEFMPETSTIPRGVRAVELDVWRARFRIRYGSDDAKGDTVRKAFQRGRETLLREEVLGVSDPYVWLVQTK